MCVTNRKKEYATNPLDSDLAEMFDLFLWVIDTCGHSMWWAEEKVSYGSPFVHNLVASLVVSPGPPHKKTWSEILHPVWSGEYLIVKRFVSILRRYLLFRNEFRKILPFLTLCQYTL